MGFGPSPAVRKVLAQTGLMQDQKRHLLELLESEPRVSTHFTSTELRALLDPSRATGSATHFVRQVLARDKEQNHDASLSA